jgi:anti-sigma factor (TIGR02949 family)
VTDAHGEMSCRELVEAVTDYLEGRLPDRDRERLEAHLEVCPHCVEYVDQMRRTIAALGTLDADGLAPETRAGLLAAFRGWRIDPPE